MPSKYPNPYLLMPDGTLKHIHPLTGTEVWTVPGRANRPLPNQNERPPQPLAPMEKEDYCDFCRARYLRTPPEKARLISDSGGAYRKLDQLLPDQLENSRPLFRRLANLFEIVTFDYWAKNHGFRLNPFQLKWKNDYLNHPQGLEHVLRLMDIKLNLSGMTLEEAGQISKNEKLSMADGFFGGSHEVITAGYHFQEGAKWDTDLFSSGFMTAEEHFQFMRFTIDALTDIYSNNGLVRYVAVYQNWLKPAGASFNHLHKQLVGLDEWGDLIQTQVNLAREDPGIYNEAIINFSARHNLIIAENEYAIVLSEIGHRYPTLAIYSKSKNTRPQEQTPEELRSFSDLLHSCHASMGAQLPCNEEWHYPPPDAGAVMPWHVLLKWRTTTPAGFEGGTNIFINPLSPGALKELVATKLFDLRKLGRIEKIRIADECKVNSSQLLHYGQK